MSKQRKTIRHYVDRETLRRALQYYPVITSQDLREWADFSDPHHDVIIVPRDEWITRIAPHTSPKIKKALSAGRGLYTVHLAGGDLLRELFYHMTPQTRFIHGAPTVCCYDFKNVPPDLYNAERARYPFRGFYYLTNIDVATFAQAYNVPEELKGDTRYLSFCNVSGNFQPDILAGILQTIRNVIQPESFFISISLLYGGKDHERREVRSII